MVKIYKIHKLAGLSGGVLLLLLAITGFFLDHDNWKFLYTTTFKTESKSLLEKENRLLESYYIDKNSNYMIIASLRGIYESSDEEKQFKKTLNEPTTAIKSSLNDVYASTSNGLYKLTTTGWESFALAGKYLTSLAIYNNTALAVEEKKYVYVIDLIENKILTKTEVLIDKSELGSDIKLSRFVRDLHYGRGLFDDGLSLLLNDYATLILIFLVGSGYYIWYLIKNKISAKRSKKLIKFHANIFVLFASLFLIILSITGIFLDHSRGLARFMSSVNIPHSILPPIYDSLKEDIWSIDYDGKIYRIGNRYGIYKSDDLKSWHSDKKGFAYKMIRDNKKLYISGMGAPNKLFYDEKYTILPNTPHMFKDVISSKGKILYLSSNTKELLLPKYQDVTLFTILLAIHDGSFFSSWWIWVNDFAAALLIVLTLTGSYRWYTKIKRRS